MDPETRRPGHPEPDTAESPSVGFDPIDGEDTDTMRVRALLAAVVLGSDDAIFAKDLDGVILTWNRGAQRIYGYTPDEIVGRNVSTLVPTDGRNDVPDIMARLRRGEAVEHYETERMAKDGRRLRVSLTISPIRDDAGRVVGASTVARDVTAIRRIEARRALLARVGESLSEVLDEEEVLRRLASLTAGELADYCVAYLLTPEGGIRRVGASHADPDALSLVAELTELHPPRIEDRVGAGMVIRTGEPVLVSHIEAPMLETAADGDERYLAVLRQLAPTSSMLLPLVARGRVLGAVAFATTARSAIHYGDDDLAFATDLASRAAMAVDNARLYGESRTEVARRREVEETLRRRYEQLRAVYRMTETVARSGELPEIYRESIMALRDAIGADRASILRFDAEGVLRFVAWEGISDEYRARVEGHTPWSQDTRDPDPIVVPDIAVADLDEGLRRDILGEGIRALAFIPLTFGGRLLGKFMLYFDEPREVASEELEVARTVAGTIGFAIVRVEDERRVRTAKEAAERASQSKSQFLGVMSHELRTPLNSVLGYSDLLLMEARGPVNGRQREYIDRIKGSAEHQLRLVEEILSFARLEAGREGIHPVPTDIARSVTDVVEFIRPEADRKGLELRTELPDEPVRIMTDPARLRQVLLNVAGNAAKFTESGRIVLSLRAEEDDVFIDVSDTGPGIPEDEMERIWEPFTQGEGDAALIAGGAGLGLTIARRFAELLGGELSAESRVGEGSRFTLRLPRVEPEE